MCTCCETSCPWWYACFAWLLLAWECNCIFSNKAWLLHGQTWMCMIYIYILLCMIMWMLNWGFMFACCLLCMLHVVLSWACFNVSAWFINICMACIFHVECMIILHDSLHVAWHVHVYIIAWWNGCFLHESMSLACWTGMMHAIAWLDGHVTSLGFSDMRCEAWNACEHDGMHTT